MKYVLILLLSLIVACSTKPADPCFAYSMENQQDLDAHSICEMSRSIEGN